MPRLIKLIKNSAETAAYQIADVYAYRGDKDQAFEWLERARRQRDAGLPGLRKDPYLDESSQATRAGTRSCARWAWPTTN